MSACSRRAAITPRCGAGNRAASASTGWRATAKTRSSTGSGLDRRPEILVRRCRRVVRSVDMNQAHTTHPGCAEIVEAQLPALRMLCQRFGVRRLDLFGSAVTGRFDPARGDIDFLVEFVDMPPGGYAHANFGFLQQMVAPFHRMRVFMSLLSL